MTTLKTAVEQTTIYVHEIFTDRTKKAGKNSISELEKSVL